MQTVVLRSGLWAASAAQTKVYVTNCVVEIRRSAKTRLKRAMQKRHRKEELGEQVIPTCRHENECSKSD
jgi:hypothetical protein